MIFIKETYPNEFSVAIQVDGRLDRNSLPTLKNVFRQQMESDSRRAISIQLNELTHVSREGKDFLREIRDQVTFVGIPEFLRLEVCPGHNLDTLEQGLEKNT